MTPYEFVKQEVPEDLSQDETSCVRVAMNNMQVMSTLFPIISVRKLNKNGICDAKRRPIKIVALPSENVVGSSRIKNRLKRY